MTTSAYAGRVFKRAGQDAGRVFRPAAQYVGRVFRPAARRAAPVTVLLILWVCATTGAAAISLVSVDQEIEIGREANAGVRRKVPELADARVLTYVRALGGRLTRAAKGPAYPYTFHVADYREINAFALPGGPVWIHRGVLQAATNESQVVGAIAHEIAHISRRHAADQLTKSAVANLGLELMGAMLGSGTSAATTRIAASVLANGMFLTFSRDDEREADRVGMEIMARAGWDPRGMIELLEILRREEKRDPGSVEVFFSTHPSPADRASRLRADVEKLRGGRRDSEQFQAARARLRRMAPPKAMPKQPS